MGKVMILAFSEDEEDVCQRMLQMISESPRIEAAVCDAKTDCRLFFVLYT